ncbi:MAG: hypothetical protein NUV86_01770 [Candidatus Scalindua sp.]|nr:hypothetical protein [Candidatus Scalindua sp.]MCR4344293.1 hypothetical protein [Candidatus Scalindua sp.]
MMTKEELKIKPGKLFIDGKWVNSVSGKTFDTLNPATEEVITSVAEGDKAGKSVNLRPGGCCLDKGYKENPSTCQRFEGRYNLD